MSNRSKSLIKNTAILSFGTFCTKGIMFFMTPLITRWLTKTDYGNFDVLHTYISLLLPVLTLACGESLFRFLLDAKDRNEKGSILSTAAVIDLAAIGAAIIVGLLMWRFLDYGPLPTVGFVFFLCTDIMYNYLMMTMRGIKRLEIYTLANILYVGFMCISCFILIKVLNLGLAGLLFSYGLGNAVAVAVVLIRSKIYRDISISHWSKQTFNNIISYSIPMIPTAISWWIVNVSDRFLIKIFMGAEFNAVYAISNKIPALCTTFFNVFNLSWQQSASETINDTDRDRYYSSVMNRMICIVGSICILVIGVNYWFFTLLFTQDYFMGYYHAPILVVAIVFSMLGRFIGGIYVAQKQTKKNGMTTVIAAVINIAVNLILINKCGLYAASVSTLVAYTCVFAIRYIDVRKTVKLTFENKTVFIFVLLAIFAGLSYIESYWLKIVLLLCGLAVFFGFNYQMVINYSKKLLKRVKK